MTLKQYLSHIIFGEDAAAALRSIWKNQQPPSEEDNRFKSSPDFSVVREKRAWKSSKNIDKKTHPFVDDILSVASEFMHSKASEEEHRHAIKLAKIAFSMTYVGKEEVIEKLLQLPTPVIEKQDLLTALAVAGEVISADLILQGIGDLFEAGDDPKRSWMLHGSDSYRLRRWLVLLPYSDRPEAILDVLETMSKKIPHLCKSWELRDLLSALGYSPSDQAQNVLEKLAQMNPSFINEYEWLEAFMKLETPTAATILLDHISDNAFADDKGRVDVSMLGKKLAILISKYSELRKEVYERYLKLSGNAKAVLEYAIGEAPDIEGVLLLIKECGEEGRKLRQTHLYSAIREMTVGERQSAQWVGAREQYSVPAPELRKEIFKIVNSGSESQAKLAKECLMLIDEFRDDHGQIESEPRHPDISSGIPWPLLTETESSDQDNVKRAAI